MSEAIDLKELPVEASQWGTNIMLQECGAGVCKRTSVSSCMNVLKAWENENIAEGRFEKCQEAMASGECTALIRRKEEIEAGHAIYYAPYEPKNTSARPMRPASSAKVDKTSDSYKLGWQKAGGEKPVRTTEKPEEKNMYAQAVEEAAKGESESVDPRLIELGRRVIKALTDTKNEGLAKALKDGTKRKLLFARSMKSTCEKAGITLGDRELDQVYVAL